MSTRKDSKQLEREVEAYEDDERDSHELSANENADLCAGCIKCCTYITVEIDTPGTPEDYDQWIWALYHDNISLFVEKPEKWYLQVDTRCGKLNEQGRCSIYGTHPVLCRQYDPRSCERRLPLLDMYKIFRTGEELEDWLRVQRPVHYQRLQNFRADHPVGGGEPALVNILPATPVRGARRNGSANGNGRATGSAATSRSKTRTRTARR